MNRRQLRNLARWWPVAVAAVIAVPVIGLGSVFWMIRSDVTANVAQAQQEFQGDRVEALIAFVDSGRHSLAERNRAVWALGQIADPRALEVLHKYYTGAECQHDTFLCQRELKKAIDNCADPDENWMVRLTHKWRTAPVTP
jgi:HEAT repeat protein